MIFYSFLYIYIFLFFLLFLYWFYLFWSICILFFFNSLLGASVVEERARCAHAPFLVLVQQQRTTIHSAMCIIFDTAARLAIQTVLWWSILIDYNCSRSHAHVYIRDLCASIFACVIIIIIRQKVPIGFVCRFSIWTKNEFL
jgi:hypothetical protein